MSEQVVRRKDASRNRERIIEAYVEVMRSHEPVALDEVAHRAGVSPATLYRHFSNRDALQRAAYAEVIQAEIVPMLASVDRDDPRGSFVEVAIGLIDLVNRHRLPGAPLLDLPALAGEMVEDLGDPLSQLLEEGRASGEIRADLDVVDALWMLQVLAAGFSVPSATEEVMRRYLSLIFDAVYLGGKGELPPRRPSV